MPFIGIALAIFILSHQSKLPYISVGIEYEDKIKHFIAFFTLGISFLFAALNTTKLSITKIIILNFIICSIYGGLDEYHQTFILGREADILDWVADSVGVIVSCLFIPMLKKRIIKRKRVLKK